MHSLYRFKATLFRSQVCKPVVLHRYPGRFASVNRWYEFITGKKTYEKEKAKYSGASSNTEDPGFNPQKSQYETEIKERNERRLNWNIKNRWEQRALDDIYKNEDVRKATLKDFAKLQQTAYITNVKKFNTVDEIYFYLENMFNEGIAEKQLSIALDIFLRDANKFEEADLEKDTFRMFLRELGSNLISFTESKNYVKTARFLDLYCIADKYLWINLETFIIKKGKFSSEEYIQILNHFANQNEGSNDFYDFYEYNYRSTGFNNLSTPDYISLGYNLYLVHHGSNYFFEDYSQNVLERIGEKTTTFDLLRVAQTFSEISKNYFKLYLKIEMLVLARYEQLNLEEVTCFACAFAISGFGTDYMFELFEKMILRNFGKLGKEGYKEILRGIIYPGKGRKPIFEMMLPRIKQNLGEMSINELCYTLNAYHKMEIVPKDFIKEIEMNIVKPLRMTKEISLEEIASITNVFCRTRLGTRDLHKLLEVTVVQRIPDLRKKPNILMFIGKKFEESGLCSLDVLKIIKDEAFAIEMDKASGLA